MYHRCVLALLAFAICLATAAPVLARAESALTSEDASTPSSFLQLALPVVASTESQTESVEESSSSTTFGTRKLLNILQRYNNGWSSSPLPSHSSTSLRRRFTRRYAH
ncbi:hypothetical protein JR316_0008768 [Psilocybe cubensis]|uniref:Uncharacterized protein n=2 Tax=Psilocybe cubensis TaxID=181762 RepID=A0ACB8GRG0_PSICU|nr:hypothetical protein JR316_0008768 [Psilocybe cubensis]KAH9478315.1 hypothetical protein JR316_0008768 [Psilocybe cubensis]